MRWLSPLVVLFVVCFMAITVPTIPAQAICVPYDIELSPESGLPGTEVTVYGHDFTAGVLVDIYYDGNLIATDKTSSKGDFTIMITIPEGCQGHHQVFVKGKYAKIDTYFTVKPGVTISPEKGPVGTTVAVEGKGFAKNEQDIELRYYLNDNYKTIERRIVANAQGSWETSFSIPTSTRGEHKIDAQGAESKLHEVKDAIFRVMAEISLDKSSGSVGDTIIMTGSRFAAYERDIQILFDGEAVVADIKADDTGYWEKNFQVPQMPAGGYEVTAEGEKTNREDMSELLFEIQPHVVLSPDEGHVGINLTVTGHAFAANEYVVIMYDGSQVTTATTNDKGSFDVSFLVPESQYGERLVTVGYAGQNHASVIFTMESKAPETPELISPPDGDRVGFTGKVTPIFDWSEVPDDSGVYYHLQIATIDEVTTNGEFVEPMISITDLTGTSYTLEEADALSYGTYYWNVQAVDRAENEGGWSTVYSFRAGLLPRWGFIVIIVIIAVLLLVLIRALVIRRGIYYTRW